jgi:hypothetical protein
VHTAFWVSDPFVGRIAEEFNLIEREKPYEFTEDERRKFR